MIIRLDPNAPGWYGNPETRPLGRPKLLQCRRQLRQFQQQRHDGAFSNFSLPTFYKIGLRRDIESPRSRNRAHPRTTRPVRYPFCHRSYKCVTGMINQLATIFGTQSCGVLIQLGSLIRAATYLPLRRATVQRDQDFTDNLNGRIVRSPHLSKNGRSDFQADAGSRSGSA